MPGRNCEVGYNHDEFDEIQSTVNEAFELMKLRALVVAFVHLECVCDILYLLYLDLHCMMTLK